MPVWAGSTKLPGPDFWSLATTLWTIVSSCSSCSVSCGCWVLHSWPWGIPDRPPRPSPPLVPLVQGELLCPTSILFCKMASSAVCRGRRRGLCECGTQSVPCLWPTALVGCDHNHGWGRQARLEGGVKTAEAGRAPPLCAAVAGLEAKRREKTPAGFVQERAESLLALHRGSEAGAFKSL